MNRSALSMLYPRKPYRLYDDLEGFVHDYHYLVLRYHRTNALCAIEDTAARYFEPIALHGGIEVGGETKFLEELSEPESLGTCVQKSNVLGFHS